MGYCLAWLEFGPLSQTNFPAQDAARVEARMQPGLPFLAADRWAAVIPFCTRRAARLAQLES